LLGSVGLVPVSYILRRLPYASLRLERRGDLDGETMAAVTVRQLSREQETSDSIMMKRLFWSQVDPDPTSRTSALCGAAIALVLACDI
jgi:hypothetical protein